MRKIIPRTVAISLSPNTATSDVRLALKLLFSPGQWLKGDSVNILEKKIGKYLGVDYAFGIDSGRSGLYLALKAMGIGPGDEVLMQAYTCVAVPNSVIWVGAVPRFVDIDPETLNIDLNDLEEKITPRTKAIIVQHTFGYPAPLDGILEISRKYGLRVIEDCAHAMGATYKSKYVGSFGDAAIFSFGRDKVISSVSGGLIVTKDPSLAQKLARLQNQLPFPSEKWIFQQLFHPVAFAGILSLYDVWKIGKAALSGFHKTGLLSLAVSPEERKGFMPAGIPAKLPAAIGAMALNQFSHLEDFNQHRRDLAHFYSSLLLGANIGLPPPENIETESIYLRYTVQVPEPFRLHRAAKEQHVYLGNWYDSVISPKNVELSTLNYLVGECPCAEELSKTSVNLPTHPKVLVSDAKLVADVVLEIFG
jgi:dTDP-4-amino-4,6-dideoxygalactose transaminase